MRDNLLSQLERDCLWLEEHNLVDYSLLVGVVNDFFSNQPQSSASASGSGSAAGAAAVSGGGGCGSGHGLSPNSEAYMSKIVAVRSSGKDADDRRSSWSLAAVHEFRSRESVDY